MTEFDTINNLMTLGIQILLAVGFISGSILLIDKYFMIRRYPILSTSSMYDLLLKDNCKTIYLSNVSRGKAKKILKSKFSLENKANTVTYLNQYFANDKMKDYSKIISMINANESEDEKSAEILERVELMKDEAIVNYRFSEDDFENIKSISAYEYANIGYIIKLALRSHYISEKKAVIYLRQLHDFVELEYTNWLEFATSFLIGKCIKSTVVDVELIYIMDFLVFDKRSIWNKVTLGEKRTDFLMKFEY